MREIAGNFGARMRARKPPPTAGFRRRIQARGNSATARRARANGKCADLRGVARASGRDGGRSAHVGVQGFGYLYGAVFSLEILQNRHERPPNRETRAVQGV